jgi:acyl carrier protein
MAYAMTPAEGVEAFERILATRAAAAQIINSTGDLQARLDQWVSLSVPAERAPATLYPRPHLANPYVAPTNETEQRIAEVWQTILGVEQVGIHDNFLELGGNSLIGTQVISRLRQAFDLNLPLTILFEAPTVAELAVAIELMLIDEIEKLTEDEAVLLA